MESILTIIASLLLGFEETRVTKPLSKIKRVEDVKSSLVFSSPKFPVRYGTEDSEMVEFEWNGDSTEYIFEVSDSKSFKRILMRELVTEPRVSINMTFPMDAFYRVKDSRGNLSEIRHLTLLRPQTPELEVAHLEHLQAIISAPTLDSKAVIQVALDPQFKNIIKAVSGLSSRYVMPLPNGRYYVRARLEYKQLKRDFTQLTSGWSTTKPISIKAP